MTSVPDLTTDVNPIPFDDVTHDARTDEPIATPLADLLAAGSDAAGVDATFMSYDEWLVSAPAYQFEPEPSYWQENER